MSTSLLLFANNATSTVNGPINTSATSVALAPGTGALFPAPGAGQYFVATFVDAATGLINEIVWVTSISGDTATIVRAQEGTTAHSWNVGDFFNNFLTAGQMSTMVQAVQAQTQAGNYALDSGAVNTMVVTLSPIPGTFAAITGAPVRVNVNHTNTSATVTLNVNGLGAISVRFTDGSLPPVGFFLSGSVWEFIYNGAFYEIANGVPIPVTISVSSSVALTGYTKLPNGVIIQFGRVVNSTGNNDAFTLPVTFPNNGTVIANSATVGTGPIICNSGIDAGYAGFHVDTKLWNGTTFVFQGSVGFEWIAIGY